MTDVQLGATEVAQIDDTLSAIAEGSGGSVQLMVDNHWPETAPEPAILSAALMGSFANRTVLVDAVDDVAVASLLRFGVASALWLREGQTTFCGSASALDDPTLAHIWTPGLRSASDAMFATDTDSTATGPFGSDYATFVDTHLMSGPSGSNDVTYLVRRWLGRRLRGEDPTAPLSDSARRWIDHVSFAIDELVDNVREHAITPDYLDTRSLLRLTFTADGTALVFAVIDNGPGICATLGPKIAATRSCGLGPRELLQKLVDGQLQGWGPGRGAGLARIVQLAHECDASVTIATDDLRVTSEARDAEVSTSVEGFPLSGTVVSVTATLPS